MLYRLTSRMTMVRLLPHALLEDKVRIQKTLVVFLSFASHGFGFRVVGTIMLHLLTSTQSTLQQIGYMIPSRALGIAAGTMLCNMILRKFDIQLVIGSVLAIASVPQIIIPYSSIWWLSSTRTENIVQQMVVAMSRETRRGSQSG